jgi:hypothetical protein
MSTAKPLEEHPKAWLEGLDASLTAIACTALVLMSHMNQCVMCRPMRPATQAARSAP